jgi:hypothetical protein
LSYRVNIKATKVENNAAKSFVEAVEKTLTVTVIDPNTVNTNAAELPETARDLHLTRCFYQSPLWLSSKYPNAQPYGWRWG